jgi:hypothetical protein
MIHPPLKLRTLGEVHGENQGILDSPELEMGQDNVEFTKWLHTQLLETDNNTKKFSYYYIL